MDALQMFIFIDIIIMDIHLEGEGMVIGWLKLKK